MDEIFTGLAHYPYEDPLVDLPLTRTIGRTAMQIETPWNADKRMGNTSLYQIQIEPYSMQYRNPQSQVKQLVEVWQNVVMPAASLLPPANLVAATKALPRTLPTRSTCRTGPI